MLGTHPRAELRIVAEATRPILGCRVKAPTATRCNFAQPPTQKQIDAASAILIGIGVMDHPNPYQTPVSPAAEPLFPIAGPLEPVGKNLRFANLVIDTIVVLVLTTAAAFPFGMVYVLAGGDINNEAALNFSANILSGVVYFLYYLGMEAGFGRTVGKFVTRTKTVDSSGAKPKAGKVALRTLCRFIPFEPFSFLGATGRGWHDSITDTWVVKSK